MTYYLTCSRCQLLFKLLWIGPALFQILNCKKLFSNFSYLFFFQVHKPDHVLPPPAPTLTNSATMVLYSVCPPFIFNHLSWHLVLLHKVTLLNRWWYNSNHSFRSNFLNLLSLHVYPRMQNKFFGCLPFLLINSHFASTTDFVLFGTKLLIQIDSFVLECLPLFVFHFPCPGI